ncbi:hypothetical protein Leryth_018410 [Lithospermum erythrorhizon]|nr:hypothetical protein Leryth_018410 [Lithospermum erythrorhizon]
MNPQLLEYHSRPQLIMETQWKPNIDVAPNCPRCASTNTKFCYYNNYSSSQPRYFCKGCKRYWTKGGSLRNVPIGGGCRKSRRSKSTRSGRVSAQQVPFPNQSNNEPSEIDMAAVFAKYVNQDSCTSEEQFLRTFINDQEKCSSGGSSGSSLKSSSITQSQFEDFLFVSQNSSPIIDQNDQCSGGENVHDFVELQNILGDDQNCHDDQAMLWPHDNISLPNVELEQHPMMVEFENFRPLSTTDYFLEESHLVSDNWNLLDFSGYDNFPII